MGQRETAAKVVILKNKIQVLTTRCRVREILMVSHVRERLLLPWKHVLSRPCILQPKLQQTWDGAQRENLLTPGRCPSLAAAVAASSFVPDEAGAPGMLWSGSDGQS